MMTKWCKIGYLILHSLLLWVGMVSAHAAEQMYFIGAAAPLGSITAPGQGSLGVYLRWDVIEGEVPADVDRFEIERDGVNIASLPARGVMSSADIAALYQGASQDRRRRELIDRLDRLDDGVSVTDGNFAQVLRDRLLNDSLWAYFGSRLDFNIARARFRGWLDTGFNASAAVLTYSLYAVNTASGTRRLVGRVEVKPSSPVMVPEAADFRQLRADELGRCDAPERYRAHGVVELNWDTPGANATEKFANALAVGGYDLYRTVDNVSSATPRDLRTLFSGVAHDATGKPKLDGLGLEKVNDLPIVIGGSLATESRREGWNPGFSQFRETLQDLLAKGLRPGDRRAYYLVARDFSGNYGRTATLVVTVPDTLAPPPPWRVRTEHDSASNRFELVWNQVDVLNFHSDHAGRTWCNLDQARIERRLTFVPEGEQCDARPPIEVDLDVSAYLVYRFEDPQEAAAFQDSDGDGVSDSAERTATGPGTACNPAASPAGAMNRLIATVPASAAVSVGGGRNVVRFADTEPAVRKGRVFWYRIASIDVQGNVGELSPPVRALFPERRRPARPLPTDFRFGTPACRHLAFATGNPDENAFARDFSSTNQADQVRVRCERAGAAVRDFFFDLVPDPNAFNGDTRAVYLDTAACQQIVSACRSLKANSMELAYLDLQGKPLGNSIVSQGLLFQECPTSYSSWLLEDCGTAGSPAIKPVTPNRVISPPLVLDPGTAVTECIDIYRTINGDTSRERRVCPPFSGPIELNPAGMGGDKVCYAIAYSNENGEVSPRLELPCVILASRYDPGVPQPIEIVASATAATAQLSWLPPEQPVTGTLLEWFRKSPLPAVGETVRFSSFEPHAGRSAKDGPIQVTVEITTLPAGTDWREEWCFRARSLNEGATGEGALSEWSALRCGFRRPPSAAVPTYLPWPETERPPYLGRMAAAYFRSDDVPVIRLGGALDGLFSTAQCKLSVDQFACSGPEPGPECFAGGDAGGQTVACSPGICRGINGQLAGMLRFVAYRQSATDPADTSSWRPFVQVSPLVDHFHCDLTSVDRGSISFSDPFVKIVELTAPAADWAGKRAVFIDQAPHETGRWYRYQLVYFDEQGEIVGYRDTDWLKVPAVTATFP